MQHEKTAAVVVIGNEVLAGKVEEINAVYFIRELRDLGVPLREVRIIPDDFDTIGRTVEEASRTFDLVFTSGGVGPTHDDMTVPAIARGLGLPLVTNPELDRLIREHYGDRVNEPLLGMARVPAGAELLWDGGLRFPVLVVRNVYIFPGDPTLLKRKFDAIRNRFRSEPFAVARLFTRCDEGPIAGLMAEAERLHPGVLVGSYPTYDNAAYSVLITVESKAPDLVAAAADYIAQRLPEGALIRRE